jgi:hypothetical protein
MDVTIDLVKLSTLITVISGAVDTDIGIIAQPVKINK